MAKDTNTVRVLERAIRERRPFVFIADLGGGKISVSGPCGKEWLDEVLTAVLAGVRNSAADPLERSDLMISVEKAREQ